MIILVLIRSLLDVSDSEWWKAASLSDCQYDLLHTLSNALWQRIANPKYIDIITSEDTHHGLHFLAKEDPRHIELIDFDQ